FATQEKDGLLIYNGRFNGEHDFIALEIVNSQIKFSFCLGSNETTSVTTNIKGGVSNGEWTTVKVEYVTRVATISVGEDCDPEIAINFQDKLGPYSCAVRVKQTLADVCNNPIKECNRLLDLTGPLQVGGMPVMPSSGQVDNQDFIGCISDLYIDHKLVDLDSPIADHSTSLGCPPKELMCQSAPCKNGGTCREGWNTFLCDCVERTGGKDCSQTIEMSRTLKGNAYLTYSNPSIIRYPWFNGVAFRTRSTSGVIMQIMLNSGDVTIQ
ncbi:protocadherin-like wing polarity protein stan, partial [Biomphalaria glabrata]